MQYRKVLNRLRKAYNERGRHGRLNRILAARTESDSPETLFKSCDDDFWFWVNTEGLRRSGVLGEVLPALPEEAVQNRFTGSAGDKTLWGGFVVYRLFKEIAEKSGKPLGPSSRILDYGCGWGRMIRFFMKDVAPANLWGIDCYDEVIEICVRTNKWCNFQLVDPLPPTNLPDGSFDLVYSYSVFSHLSEDAHLRWLEEFHRILKPGGLVIATTWPRDLILRCAQIRAQKDHLPWESGLAASFVDTEQALAAYDRGEYCHSPVGGGDGLARTFYGETSIPKKYVMDHWTQRFQFVDYIEDRHKCPQNVIVVRK